MAFSIRSNEWTKDLERIRTKIRFLKARQEELVAPLQQEIDSLKDEKDKIKCNILDSAPRVNRWLSAFLDSVVRHLPKGKRSKLWTILCGHFIDDVAVIDSDRVHRKKDIYDKRWTFEYTWSDYSSEVVVLLAQQDGYGYVGIETHPDLSALFHETAFALSKQDLGSNLENDDLYIKGLEKLPHFLWPAALVYLACKDQESYEGIAIDPLRSTDVENDIPFEREDITY